MKLRCLVVDDDDCFLTAVRHMLEREGVTADTVLSGSAALHRVDECWPDIALIDVRLGVEDGFDVAKCLEARARARPRHDRRLVMLFISDYAEEDFAQQIAMSPASGFLAKSALSDYLSEETIRELVFQWPFSSLQPVLSGTYAAPNGAERDACDRPPGSRRGAAAD